MKSNFKVLVKKVLGYVGLRVALIDRRQVSDANKLKWLRDLRINTIIDIGANKGHFSSEIHSIFSDASIFSFEPLPDCFALTQKRMLGVSNFHAYNIALSDTPGTVTMHRSSYSGSSSLLPMAQLHKDLFPVTAGERPVQVKTDTLDNVMGSENIEEPILMKIDVQGFEHKVLAGAVRTLRRVKVIIIETSFRELYLGQPLFGDIYTILTGQGFEYKGTWDPDFRSPQDGSSIQQDAVFIRS
jgi:FkbM family methyltransferase